MQNRRTYLILVGLILAALAGVAALAIPGSPAHKKVTLGLDLETSLTGPSISASGNPQQSPSLYALLSQVQSEAKKGTPEGYYVVGKNKEKSVGPFQTRAAALSQAKAANLKKPYTVLAVPQN